MSAYCSGGFKMKKLSLMAVLAGISTLAVGGVGISSAVLSQQANQNVSPVNADGTITVSASLAPSIDTMRYWFINNISNSFWNDSAKMGIHVWGGTGVTDTGYLMNGYANTSGGQTFFYVDIPLNTVNFQILRCSSGAVVGTNQSIWNYGSNFTTASYGPSYLHWCSGSSEITGLSNSPADNPGPSAYLLSEVLKGYCTCSDSSINGYRAASLLYTNWWKYKTSANGDVSVVSLPDYSYDAYVAAGNKYTASMTRGAYPTVIQKYEALCAKANINPDSGVSLSGATSPLGTTSDSTPWIITALGLIGVVGAATAFFFLRRKHVA